MANTLLWQVKEKLGIVSPSKALNKITSKWHWSAIIGIQKAMLKNIHKSPYSPILGIRSEYEYLSATPFEVWANGYDYGMSCHCGFIDQFENEEVK